MKRKTILIQMPVATISGYGALSRDICKSLFKILPESEYELMIDATMWGNCPHGALNPNDPEDKQIIDHYIKDGQLKEPPDLFLQNSIPSEFSRVGKTNWGFTAGTETSLASLEFCNGANQMDLIVVPSTFTKNVLGSTKWSKKDQQSGKILNEIACIKPIEVLFEGLDTDKYFKIEWVD